MKTIKTIIISILICMSLFGSVSAAGVQRPETEPQIESGTIQPRGEETRWYYRTVDGVKQMRLWSITYGRWLTDWITV